MSSLENKRNLITLNLSICLLAMHVLVLAGLSRRPKQSVIVCTFVSAAIQYTVLASFLWMLLEGLLLYYAVIIVFQRHEGIKNKTMCGVAYGVPIIIIAISYVSNPTLLISEKYCWISNKKGMVWSILAPIALIIIFNIVIFVRTLYAAMNLDKANLGKVWNEEKKNTLMKRCKGMLSLAVLLGFTWSVGFFQYPNGIVAAYLFNILNGSQGLFLFITQVALNKDVQKRASHFYKEHVTEYTSRVSCALFSAKSSREKLSLNFSNIMISNQLQVDSQPQSCVSPPELDVQEEKDIKTTLNQPSVYLCDIIIATKVQTDVQSQPSAFCSEPEVQENGSKNSSKMPTLKISNTTLSNQVQTCSRRQPSASPAEPNLQEEESCIIVKRHIVNSSGIAISKQDQAGFKPQSSVSFSPHHDVQEEMITVSCGEPQSIEKLSHSYHHSVSRNGTKICNKAKETFAFPCNSLPEIYIT